MRLIVGLFATIARRSSNTGSGIAERAMIAARITEKRKHGQRSDGQICPSGAVVPTIPEAATSVGVSTRMVNDARTILQSGDADLVAKVDAGDIAPDVGARLAA